MIVLCTGCGSGFGLGIAVHAARAGHTVYAGVRDLSRSGRLEEAAAGLPVHPVELDVTNAAQREEVVQHVLRTHGRIDALINNAGIALAGVQEQIAEDELRTQYDVNVIGPFALTKLVLGPMRTQGSGLILNVSSMAGRQALPGLGAYASSKFALEGLTEALRHEMRPHGVRVVLLEPGPYRTDIFGRNRWIARASGGPYETFMRRMEKIADRLDKRAGDPEQVARLAVRLLTEPRPKLRYPIGPGVPARVWARRVLPFELTERVIARVLSRAQ